MATTGGFFVLLGMCFTFAYSKQITFEPCGGTVQSVDVDPCEKEPCEIPRGESAIITMNCKSNTDAEKLRLSVFASVQGFEMLYPGMKRDACKGKNVTCPITNNQEFSLVQKLPVRKAFPKIETTARFLLTTDDDREMTVCCFKTPVTVV